MQRRMILSGTAIVLLSGALWFLRAPNGLSEQEFESLYKDPLPAPVLPVSLYHLGHSLVGRDMPAMFAALGGHSYASQLGWGASLLGHWTGDVPGFSEENTHPQFRPAAEAADSGEYGVVVLTEMVEIRDAIKYFDSPEYLAKWAARFRAARPETRVFLYETWHSLDDPKGWLDRIDEDLSGQWEGEILRTAMAHEGVGTVYVIPGGQVMAAAARAAERGEVPNLSRREDLFATLPDGTTDRIHFNDLGAYLMALTHYAVIYQRSPIGLPHELRRADGEAITPIASETAEALQRIVWDVVRGYGRTGLPRS